MSDEEKRVRAVAEACAVAGGALAGAMEWKVYVPIARAAISAYETARAAEDPAVDGDEPLIDAVVKKTRWGALWGAGMVGNILAAAEPIIRRRVEREVLERALEAAKTAREQHGGTATPVVEAIRDLLPPALTGPVKP